MRLSEDTLLELARAGDLAAEKTVIFLAENRDAEAHSVNGGNIGAGWPGISNARRWPFTNPLGVYDREPECLTKS
jgi:hypothetical protein